MTQISNLTSIGYPVTTLEDLRKVAPSAFADKYDPKRSDRYSFLPTEKLVSAVMNQGWELQSVKQNGRSEYSRHIIRFTNPSLGFMNLKDDKVKPQIILDNSHNGTSYAQFHMGLFRLICTNGLVAAMPGFYETSKIRHMGMDVFEIKNMLEIAAEHYKMIGTNLEHMQGVTLNQDQKEEFAIKAIAYREPNLFINDDGTIDYQKVTDSTNPLHIIKPTRDEDKIDNLWTTFNVVQEHMIKGGYERKSEKGRSSTTKGMTNAVRSVKYNKKLWELAESYM